MSANKARPHVIVLAEDDANRDLAVGFYLECDSLRQMQVLRVAGGWRVVLEQFKAIHSDQLARNPNRYMVLLIDLDGQADRLRKAKTVIPGDLIDRVFVLGVRTEPEDLRRAMGEYESIGRALARDCRNGTNSTWGHDLLKHNATELDRLRPHVLPILFPVMEQ